MPKKQKIRISLEDMTVAQLEHFLSLNLHHLETLGQKIDRVSTPKRTMLKTYHELELKIDKIRRALKTAREKDQKHAGPAHHKLAIAET